MRHMTVPSNWLSHQRNGTGDKTRKLEPKDHRDAGATTDRRQPPECVSGEALI